jgi:GDP-4-dehydro-6-deoxy-D-mannose reductase
VARFSVMRRAIVTGAQGFIGRSLVKALRRNGVDVRTLGRQGPEPTHLVLEEESWQSPALQRIVDDIVPDCIFHLVGAARGTESELTRINVGLTQALLRVLRQTSLQPLLVIAGSAAEYGSAIIDGEPIRETAVCAPLSAYGVSKHTQTREALSYADATGKPVLVARIFNPIGPGMPPHLVIGDFARQLAAIEGRRGTLRVGNLDVRRDMIDVDHIATLLFGLAANPDARGVVNVCGGQAPLLRDLVEMLIAVCGREIDIEVDQTRMRANEPHTIIGSTDLLTKFGCPPPATNFPAVIARVWQEMEASRACTP